MVFDSLVAGAIDDAAIAFTPNVDLPIGSKIKITFPSEIVLDFVDGSPSKADAISDESNINIGSTITIAGQAITVMVAGSSVSASTVVSFKVKQVTNPGQQTTGTFSIETFDPSGNLYQDNTSIGGINIVSTSLVNVSVEPDDSHAGIIGSLTIAFETGVVIPSSGSLEIVLPVDYTILESCDVSSLSGISGSMENIDGHKVVLALDAEMSVGSKSIKLTNIVNPGATTTGSYTISLIDASGNEYQFKTDVPGSLIISGDLRGGLTWTPTISNPGIQTSITIQFISSAFLAAGSRIVITSPSPSNYVMASNPSVTFVIPSLVTTTSAVWDSDVLIIVTGSVNIGMGYLVKIVISDVEMPAHVLPLSTSGTITTFTSNGLNQIFDGPTMFSASEIVAGVISASPTFSPVIAHPGITTGAHVTFTTSGKISIADKIVLTFPASSHFDFAQSTLSFLLPLTGVTGTPSWDVSTHTLTISLTTVGLDEFELVKIQFDQVKMPPSARSEALGTVATTTSSNVAIDGPSDLTMVEIPAGPVSGARTWISTQASPGIQTSQTIAVMTYGAVGVGGVLRFTLPNDGWSLSLTFTPTFVLPEGMTGTGAWDSTSRTVEITTTGGDIPSSTKIELVIPDVETPDSERTSTIGTYSTLAPDGLVIDGPGDFSLAKISRGAFTGSKSFISTLATPGRTSTAVIEFTLHGRVPSGGTFVLTLPQDQGWTIAASSPDVSMTTIPPTTSTTTVSASWNDPVCILTTAGLDDLIAGSQVTLSIANVQTPPSVRTDASFSLQTTVANGRVIDEAHDMNLNAVGPGTLSGLLTLVSEKPTPAIPSTHTLSWTSSGGLVVDSILRLRLPHDWSMPSVPEISFSETESSGQQLTATASWSEFTHVLDVTLTSHDVSILENTPVVMTIADVRTPPSVQEESSTQATLESIYRDGLQVDQPTTVVLNALTVGTLTGDDSPPSWTVLTSEGAGPVASLVNTATVVFTTSGRVQSGGQIQLKLPKSWSFTSASPGVSFTTPVTVAGSATTSFASVNDGGHLVLTISLTSGTLEHLSKVELVVSDVVNPDNTQVAGVVEIHTFSAETFGAVDSVVDATTSSIESKLQHISSAGDALVLIEHQVKVFTFVGDSVSANDFVKLVDSTTVSTDAGCGDGLANAVSGEYQLDTSHGVEMKLDSSHTLGSMKLCYRFENNPYKLMNDDLWTLKRITSVSSDAGSNGVMVAGYGKTWHFHGTGVASGDRVRWLHSGTDCTTSENLAVVHSGEDAHTYVISNADAITISIDPSAWGKTLTLCYQFGTEPYQVYDAVTAVVVHATSVSAVEGLSNTAVANYPKVLSFEGHGMAEGDRVKWTRSSTGCHDETDNAELVTEASPESSVSDTLAASMTFSATVAGQTLSLCYQFGAEPYHLMSHIQLQVVHVQSLMSNKGAASLAVVNVPETLSFSGPGVSLGDQVRWIGKPAEDAPLTSEDCTDPTNFMAQEVSTATLDSDLGAEVHFYATGQPSTTATLCYQFASEPFVLVSSLVVAVAQLKRGLPTQGAPSVAVVNYPKTFRLVGDHLASGDKVGWTRESNCAELVVLEESSGSTSQELQEDLTITSTFTSAESGVQLKMCYQFATEPPTLVPEIVQVQVKMVHDLKGTTGDTRVAVLGVPKTFEFMGDGLESGDFAKFIDPDGDCHSSPGVAVRTDLGLENDPKQMALQLWAVDKTDAVVDVFHFIGSGLEGLVMCYKFGIEPYVSYPDLALTLHDISSISVTKGKSDVVVVGDPKELTFGGTLLAEGDQVHWVYSQESSSSSHDDCLNSEVMTATESLFSNQTIVMNVSTASDTEAKALVLCYKFGNEPFALFRSFPMMIKELKSLETVNSTSSDPTLAIVGLMKSWQVLGLGMSEGDRAKWIYSSSSTNGGSCDDESPGGEMHVSKVGTFDATFLDALLHEQDRLWLCYQFEHEPYALMRDIRLEIKLVSSVSLERAIVGSVTELLFSGQGLEDGDEFCWQSSSSEDVSTLECVAQALTNRRALVDFSTFTSILSSQQLFLVYKFQREQAFVVLSHVSVQVIRPYIHPQTFTAVANEPLVVTFSGTFGLTGIQDSFKWVHPSAVDCTAAAQGLATPDDTLSITDFSTFSEIDKSSIIQNLRKGQATTASVSYARNSTSATQYWKLCYQFSLASPMLVYPEVALKLVHVDLVRMTSMTPDTLGNAIDFAFEGTGLAAGDRAKWISASATSSNDCSTFLSLSGPEVTISDPSSVRQYFPASNGTSTKMKLCYQFKTFGYHLYQDELRVQDDTSTTNKQDELNQKEMVISPKASASQRTHATVQLKLNKDMNDYPPGSDAEKDLKDQFTADIATSLGIDASR